MDEPATTMVEQDAQHPGGLRRRLGRGLSALLGGGPNDEDTPLVVEEPTERSDAHLVSVDMIDRNPFQPRKDFAEEALRELAASIKQHGLLQPLLVRECEGRFQLVAGERRWLAARVAKLTHVPCRVMQLEDRQVYEVAIEENVKRKDLGVLEKAEAFRDYLQRFGCSIEELAGRLSMNRATVSNFLRLLDLSEPVKQAVNDQKITNGHARALLSLEETDQIALCERIIADSLSVRKTEEAVKEIQRARQSAEEQGGESDVIPIDSAAPQESEGSPQEENGLSSHVLNLQEQLRGILGAKVEIQVKGKDAGKILIPFASSEEFEAILHRLRRAAA